MEQRADGAWVEVATTRTGRDGVWSAYPRLSANGPLRAVAPASEVVSAEVPVEVRTGVRLRAAPRVLRVGGTLRLTGATTPPKPRVRLVVERRLRSGAWRRISARSFATTGGRFEATLPLRRPGVYRLTAATRADAANAAGFSPARVVRVLPGRNRSRMRRGVRPRSAIVSESCHADDSLVGACWWSRLGTSIPTTASASS